MGAGGVQEKSLQPSSCQVYTCGSLKEGTQCSNWIGSHRSGDAVDKTNYNCGVHILHDGVLYFGTVIWFHGTRVNVI